jgi:hypothetical protein
MRQKIHPKSLSLQWNNLGEQNGGGNEELHNFIQKAINN